MCIQCQRILSYAPTEVPALVDHRPRLAKREIEVILSWLIHDTKERAARELYLSPSTVKTVIQRVRTKYDDVGRSAPTQVSLLIRLLQDGLVNVEALLKSDFRFTAE